MGCANGKAIEEARAAAPAAVKVDDVKPTVASPDQTGDQSTAATKVQAIMRGRQARDDIEEEKRLQWLGFHLSQGKFEEAEKLAISAEEAQYIADMKAGKVAVPSDESVAATKMQAMMRGRLARDDIEEEKRLNWLGYYLSQGNFEEAEKLAIGAEEAAHIAEAKTAAK